MNHLMWFFRELTEIILNVAVFVQKKVRGHLLQMKGTETEIKRTEYHPIITTYFAVGPNKIERVGLDDFGNALQLQWPAI